MSQVRMERFEAYGQYLDQHPEEHAALVNTILINVTSFFRDPEAWQAVAETVIPGIVGEAADSRSLRIWSAGCSSGEEPFTVAMLLAEHLGDRVADYAIKIYGTDIDEDALATARQALYRRDHLGDVPDVFLDRYFTRDGHDYRLRRELRRWCIFGSHNVAMAPPLSHIDLLVCRNVLIYVNSELQERILARFHYAVRDEGYLFLGRSESLLARSRLFTPVQLKWRIFQRLPASARTAAAVLPEGAASPAPGIVHSRVDPPPAGVRAQRALEALPVAVMVIDMSDTIVTWNPAAEVLFEIPASSALGRKFRDLDVSYRVEGLRAQIEDVKARHAGGRMENLTFARRTGDTAHVDIAIAPLSEGPRLGGVLVCAEEATEHARLREQMTRVAEQHATAIEELQSTNEELETTNEELQSTNEELETTNEELQSTNEELETTVEELQAANSELAALNTEMESRSAELARLDVYHHGVVDALEQGVIVLDPAGVVRTWNRAAERIWGLRAGQVLGREFFVLPVGEVARLVRQAFARVLEGAPLERLPGIPYTSADGHERRAVLRVVPVKSEGGEVLGIVGVISPTDESSAEG
jgi:two-component system CheB/CheR fusion protein